MEWLDSGHHGGRCGCATGKERRDVRSVLRRSIDRAVLDCSYFLMPTQVLWELRQNKLAIISQ